MGKEVSFTICANNYLAHAKTLSSSFMEHHSNVNFIIAILDTPNKAIHYNELEADKIIWVPEIFPELIADLKDTYSIAELCTVVKPVMFEYFYKAGYNQVLYLDPDIQVFSEFKEVFKALETNDVVLTPHICSPTGDVGHPLDKDLMRTGIYNLGFLAMNNTPEILKFIDWWHRRVKAYGFHNLNKGFFYDQIWLGYAPAFLDKVFILRHLGYNVANWNLHERKLLMYNEVYYINGKKTHLRFFHFSHFKIDKLPEIASYNQNFNLTNRPDINSVFQNYKGLLIENNYERLKIIDYTFGKREPIKIPIYKKESNRFMKVAYLLKKAVKILIKG